MAENRGRTSQRRQLKNLQGKRFSTSRAWKGHQTNVWGYLPASTEWGGEAPGGGGACAGRGGQLPAQRRAVSGGIWSTLVSAWPARARPVLIRGVFWPWPSEVTCMLGGKM